MTAIEALDKELTRLHAQINEERKYSNWGNRVDALLLAVEAITNKLLSLVDE